MSAKSRDFRGVIRPVGAVVLGIGVMIALCSGVGMIWDRFAPDPSRPQGGSAELALSAIIVSTLGMIAFLYGNRFVSDRISRREALLAVSLIWIAAGACGAVPFILGAGMSFDDAFFESVSGLTTTGATVIADIEGRLSRPLLLWRSLIQWLGGMGIVVLFVAVFPNLGAGGKHLFRGEVPGTTAEGLRPRIAETSFALWKLYGAFTVIEIALLKILGLDLFDAVCHAFTTMSTGGFSTLDSSVGGFNSAAVEYVIATFMLIGTVNYGLYYALLRTGNWRSLVRNIEFRWYVAIVAVTVVVLTILNLSVHDELLTSFRYSFFMVATTISSTGYGTDDYSAYSSTALAIVILLMFVGGCSGSTAGGIKIERAVLMGKQAIAQIQKSFRPATVQLVRMGRAAISNQVLSDVASFFLIYMGCIGAGLLFVTLVEGVPAPTAFGAMLTCLSNMGPAPFHVGPDNFAAYSAGSKLFFALAMLLGRLEFFTLFALILPGFWRR
ncbi:MAG: TrkH family potassium uptake protein [Deltaproteobacteria bacterium]|nr:TrkH family potassium uptake protein [Deltaproteobacteria bacterium]